MKTIYSYIMLWRSIFAFIMMITNNNTAKIIKKDAVRYCNAEITLLEILRLIVIHKTFRNVFYYRFRKNYILRFLSMLLLRPLDQIEIEGDIGPGLLIYHKRGVTITCKKAGENLTIGPGVIIGKGDRNSELGTSCPIIGDNVRIASGAIVFGGIKIGNNSIVGAGTVLNKDVPSNSVVVGNPAKIIKSE